MKKFILSHNGINWFITSDGQLIGYADAANKIPYYEFWIGNPPQHDTADHRLFTAVCNFAVSMGLLRTINTYAIVKENYGRVK